MIPHPVVLADLACEPLQISEEFKDIIEPYDQWIPMEPTQSGSNHEIKTFQPAEEEIIQVLPKVIFSQHTEPLEEEEELIVSVEEHKVQSSVNEEMLQDDNEFILSVMREYEDKLNDSVIFKPPKHVSSVATMFDKYLDETINMDSPRSSDAPLSTIPSDRSEPLKTFQSMSTQTEPPLPSAFLPQLRRDSDLSSGITSLSSGTQGITPLSHRSIENTDIDPTFLDDLFQHTREMEQSMTRTTTFPPLITKPPPYRSPTLVVKHELKTSKESHLNSNNEEELPTEIMELLSYGKRIIDDTISTASEENDNEAPVEETPCEVCTSCNKGISLSKERKHDIILNKLIRKSEQIRETVSKAFDGIEDNNTSGAYVPISAVEKTIRNCQRNTQQQQDDCDFANFQNLQSAACMCTQVEEKHHFDEHCHFLDQCHCHDDQFHHNDDEQCHHHDDQPYNSGEASCHHHGTTKKRKLLKTNKENITTINNACSCSCCCRGDNMLDAEPLNTCLQKPKVSSKSIIKTDNNKSDDKHKLMADDAVVTFRGDSPNESSDNSLSAILNEVECRIANADDLACNKKKSLSSRTNQKKFIPLLTLPTTVKKATETKKEAGDIMVCCASMASSDESSTEMLDKKQNRKLPAIPKSTSKQTSVTDQCHALKLPCPIEVQKCRAAKDNARRGDSIPKLRRTNSLSETSRTQKYRPTLRRLNSFTEGVSQQPDSLLNTSIPMLQREIKFLRTQCDSLCQELVVGT